MRLSPVERRARCPINGVVVLLATALTACATTTLPVRPETQRSDLLNCMAELQKAIAQQNTDALQRLVSGNAYVTVRSANRRSGFGFKAVARTPGEQFADVSVRVYPNAALVWGVFRYEGHHSCYRVPVMDLWVPGTSSWVLLSRDVGPGSADVD